MAEYNGWSNYETWAFQMYRIENTPDSFYETQDDTYELSKILKDEAEEMLYDMMEEAGINGWMHDICANALSRIDFYEIAEHIIDNNEKEKEFQNAS